MPVTTIQINSRDELLARLMSYDSGWLFRGHAQAMWNLESSLERLLSPLGWDPDIAKRCEAYALHMFGCKAHHYIARDMLPETKLAWMSLLQHHGVPTRLVDFTESPFTALFFAFESVSPDQPEPCAIWAIKYREIMKASVSALQNAVPSCKLTYHEAQMRPDEVFEDYLSHNSYDILWVTEPRLQNLRLERQKGTFLLSGNICKRIVDLLPHVPAQSVHKIVIPACLADDAFRMLTSMGIDNGRLFADLEGLARDVKRMMLYQGPHRLFRR